MYNSGFTALPWGGELLALTCRGKYLGWGGQKGQVLKVVEGLNANEKFIVEVKGKQYNFKQQVSNLYFGGCIDQGNSPIFVQAKNRAQIFFLEPTNDRRIRIRSVIDTYLCAQQNNDLKFKKNPKSVEQCSWKIHVLDSNFVSNIFPQIIQSTHNSFFPDDSTIVIRNKYGIIGRHGHAYQNLCIAHNPLSNEHFRVVKTNDGRVGFKQMKTSLFIGHNANEKDKLLLTPVFEQHQKFTIQPKGDNQFAIINKMNLYVAVKNQNIILRKEFDDSCIWEYKVSNQNFDLPIYKIGTAKLTQRVSK